MRRTSPVLDVLAAAALLMVSSSADAETFQASRTIEFLNTLGVNGHIGGNGTPYLSASGIVADAQYLGIRSWRDSLSAQSSWQLGPLQALVNAGIGLVGLPLENQTITVSDHINRAKVWAALGPHALMALEGPNEPNNFPITYNGTHTGAAGNPTTFMPVAQFQRDYYQAIRNDPVLKTKPLWSVSLTGAEPNNVGLQYLTIPSGLSGVLMPGGTVYADVANLHFYPMYASGAQTIDETNNRFDTFFDSNFVRTYARGFTGYTDTQADALPKVITEFGYPATGGSPNGITVDIPTQGKNILTGLFNAWAARYQHVYIYALYEEGDGFGLFWNTNSPKPSATYIHNLTSVLADTGWNAWSFIPGQLSYTFSGLPRSAHSSLFQKSNGNFALVLWNNIANWNFTAGTSLAVGPTNVTISLGTTASSIAVYNPTSGTAPIKSAANTKSITVPLSDHPVVVEIAAPPPPAPAPTATLTATPSQVKRWRKAQLTWASSNATSCTGGGFSTAGAVNGSSNVRPSSNTTYSVSCAGPGGTASATATVAIKTEIASSSRD